MRRSKALFFALVAFACAIFFAPKSSADGGLDFHWDVEVQAGVMNRWFTHNTPSYHPSLGPSAQVSGHVALLPLVHVGAYFGGDLSPYPGGGLRNFEYGGPHVRIMIPLLPKTMRLWLATGVGIGRSYEKSFHAAKFNGKFYPSDRYAYGEVPLGIGASYKFWPGWSVFSEVSGRVLFGNSAPDASSSPALPPTTDRYALGLSVGIMLDR